MSQGVDQAEAYIIVGGLKRLGVHKLMYFCFQLAGMIVQNKVTLNNNNNNLYLHYSGRGKRKEEKKQNIENKIMEDL